MRRLSEIPSPISGYMISNSYTFIFFRPLLLDDHEDWKNSFDIVFAADCFFNNSHGGRSEQSLHLCHTIVAAKNLCHIYFFPKGLLKCIDFLLSKRPGSTFLALAPLRGNTLKSFVSLSLEVCEPFQWTVKLLTPEAVFPEISGDPEKMVPHMVYIQRQ